MLQRIEDSENWPMLFNFLGARSCVFFGCPFLTLCSPPYEMLYSSYQVQIYSSTTNEVKKTLSKFKDKAFSGCFRADGKLVVAGTEDNSVKVYKKLHWILTFIIACSLMLNV